MGVPHVTSCCCLGLEGGAKVIGVLHLIISVSLTIVCSIYAEQFRSLAGTTEDTGDNVYATWYKLCTGVAVATVCHFALAVILLVGAYSRRSGLVRAWALVMSALWVAALALDVALLAINGISGSGTDMFLSLLFALLFFGTLAYCILCVYSYYLLLKSSEDMEGPGSSPY